MTDPHWPARLSVAASFLLAIALFWPDPRAPVKQAIIMPTALTEPSMPPANPVPITLPPPPRLTPLQALRQSGAEKNPARPVRRPLVTPLRPAGPAQPSAPVPTVDSLQPSAKEQTKPVVALVPAKRSESRPAAAASKPLPRTSPPAAVSRPAASSLAQGRALLRILEHGTGPEIDFAWPENSGSRNALFALLSRCYGMQVVLLDGANRLYRLADPAGRPWAPNIDRISGFSRRIGGLSAAGERDLVIRLRRRHTGITNARPIRLFPRAFDGALLGGLAQLIGKGAADLRSLSARYRMRGERLWMIDVRVNGRSVPGRVDLSPVAACATARRRV